MKKLLLSITLFVIIGSPLLALAQVAPPPDEFYKAKIESVEFEDEQQYSLVTLLNGPDKGTQLELDSDGFSIGDRAVVTRAFVGGNWIYRIYDHDRTWPLVLVSGIFFITAIFFGRLRGFTSIIGMLLSLGILVIWVIPKIIAGSNPLVISIIGAAIIAVISLYIAHGFNKRTSISLAATLLTLAASSIITILFVWISKLTGTAQEEAIMLQVQGLTIDLKGLLLGGIIIGSLGILDDITTAQVAVVDELHQTNPSLHPAELYRKGLSVGREHIASLINTLVLAYAGASFPLLLIFAIDKDTPMWISINSEFIAEEIIRTLSGSMALVLAVPISTLLAVYIYKEKHKRKNA